jgi:hypothetical protein
MGVARAIGVYFPIAAKLPEFEEFFTAKSNKSKMEDQNASSSFTFSTSRFIFSLEYSGFKGIWR